MAEVRWRKSTRPIILLSTGIDLTGATLQIDFKKPSGATITKVGADGVSDNGAPAAGQIKYEFEAAVLDEVGQWQAVANVTIGGKAYKNVPAATFTVVDDFD